MFDPIDDRDVARVYDREYDGDVDEPPDAPAALVVLSMLALLGVLVAVVAIVGSSS